mgnify:FL=1
MTKRINKTLRQFFEEKPLTDWEKDFIIGCIKFQNNSNYSQVTSKQWNKIMELKKKYGEENACT